MAMSVDEVRKAQRADGTATILSIGTANPPTEFLTADFPDYYFRVMHSEHMTDLKNKFKRICEGTTIRKRNLYLTEELLKKHPNIGTFDGNSLNIRQEMMIKEIPRLGAEAAEKAIAEWGQPRSKITHMIFCTTAGVDMPGADFQLNKLLGLNPNVKKFMMYQQGCAAGGTILRLAKTVAENEKGSRVLVVCSESIAIAVRGPHPNHIDSLIGQILFGDGAAAMIVAADPDLSIERPLFQLVAAYQSIIPDSEKELHLHLREHGLTFHLRKRVPYLIADSIEKQLKEGFDPLGISDWNSIFWVPHPGGPAILDEVEAKLDLTKDKFRFSRHVLQEYGNLTSACVLFIMDEMRRESKEKGQATTGDGLDWGVLFGFGPGITIEMLVLRSAPIA